MADQIRYSFDGKSVQKMLKGMLYAVAPAAIMAAIAFLKEAKWESTIVSFAMPWVIMVLTNVANEWRKGIDPTTIVPTIEVKDERTVGFTDGPSGIDKSF
jgi:hypothetical protein